MTSDEAFKQWYETAGKDGVRLDGKDAWDACLEFVKSGQEPVGFLFQHEETGLTEVVDAQQVEWGFEKNNPRWQKIGPVFTHPAPAQPVRLNLREISEIHMDWVTSESTNFADFINAIMDAMLVKGAGRPAVVQPLVDAIQAAIDCGMVPVTSATEGGAAKHSIQVRVADQLRAALKAAKGE